MYVATMTGIELGFHRYFAHRTFETTRSIRALLLILGSMAGQGAFGVDVRNYDGLVAWVADADAASTVCSSVFASSSA